MLPHDGLRALLIQKDVKHPLDTEPLRTGLRALLIQKDVKPGATGFAFNTCLRALLIQKDVKQITGKNNVQEV